MVTRKLPRTDEVVAFFVAAEYDPISRPTSAPHWRVTDIADELAYAVSYKRGLFNGEQKPRKPMAWAMKAVTAQGPIA